MAEAIGLASAAIGILGSMLVVRNAIGTVIKDLDTNDRRVFTLEALSRQASAVEEALEEWRHRWYLTAGRDTMLAISYWGQEKAERFKVQARSIYEEAMTLEEQMVEYQNSKDERVKRFLQAVHLVAGKLDALTQRMDFVEKEVGRLMASSNRAFKAFHKIRGDISPEDIMPFAVKRLLDALRVKRCSQFRVLNFARQYLHQRYPLYDEHLINYIEGDRVTHLLNLVERDQCPYGFHIIHRADDNPCRQVAFDFQDRHHRQRDYFPEFARVPCEMDSWRSIKDVLEGRATPSVRRQDIIEMAYGLAENLVLFPGGDLVCTCRMQQYIQSSRLTPTFVKRQGNIEHNYPCFLEEVQSLRGDTELHCLSFVLFDIALGQTIQHRANHPGGYCVFVSQRSGLLPIRYRVDDLIEQLSINPTAIADSAWVPRDLADAVRGCSDVAFTDEEEQARFESLFRLIYWPLFKQYNEVVYSRSRRSGTI